MAVFDLKQGFWVAFLPSPLITTLPKINLDKGCTVSVFGSTIGRIYFS